MPETVEEFGAIWTPGDGRELELPLGPSRKYAEEWIEDMQTRGGHPMTLVARRVTVTEWEPV